MTNVQVPGVVSGLLALMDDELSPLVPRCAPLG